MQLKDTQNQSSNIDQFSVNEIERLNLSYEDHSNRFYSASKDFSKQYAHIYSARLQTYRNILSERVSKKWGNKYPVLKLCELVDKERHTVIIGTLFIHQELKPSILKEISDKLEIIPQAPRTHFVHDDDTLVLEDELQRIKISGDVINVHQVVTGVVCAVLGFEEDDGIFKVLDVCWPDCGIQKPIPVLADDKYVVIMSGLDLASRSTGHYFSVHLVMEWISGMCGNFEYQKEVSKIARLIIAGGLYNSNKGISVEDGEADVGSASATADAVCASLSSTVELDVMPGCRDPTGVMLPQKPFHYCLFPKSTVHKTFHRVTNPYECDIGGFKFVGTSGEGVRDVLRYSSLESCEAGMRATLQWRHLAPTAPDTAPCLPCLETDPFIMYSCPHVYFMGNADRFSTELYEGPGGQRVRIVCVPDFYESRTVAIVNLRTFECQPMRFY